MFQSAVIHDEIEFTRHNSSIGAICYNWQQDTFVSVDETCLRLWHAQTGTQLRVVSPPSRTSQFIKTIISIDSRRLFVASALDDTLRFYDSNLNELAALSTGRGTVLTMVFDTQHHRLLTGGFDGCGAWHMNPRPPGLPEGTFNPHYEFISLLKFFHDTTATTYLSRHRSQKQQVNTSKSTDERLAWVEHLQLSLVTSQLYAQTRYYIDVFHTTDGAHLERWYDLFPSEHGTLSAFVVQESTKTLICGTSRGAIIVLSYSPISLVHIFEHHTQTITSLTEHLTSHLVISSSLDGSVRLWDSETRRQVHRHNIGHSVYSLQLLPLAQITSNSHRSIADRFYCQLRNSVKIYTIQSIFKDHQSSLVPFCLLQRVVFPYQDSTQLHDHGNENESLDNDENEQIAKQLVVLVSMDKTLRIFPGRSQKEAPKFTWTPDKEASDLVAFALNPVSQHLFLLMKSQNIVIVNASHPLARTTEKDNDSDFESIKNNVERIIDFNVSISAPTSNSCLEKDKNDNMKRSLRCLCVCPYAPIINAVPSSQRPPRQRRQSIFGSNTPPVPLVSPLQRRNAPTEWEWIACGCESGQLVFWHTGLCGGREATLTFDAHDAPIVNISASISSALLVTFDAVNQMRVWNLHPKFVLRNVLVLGQSPSLFALSPLSEIILNGYDDGRVILHALRNQNGTIQTFKGKDDDHDTIVCAGDFLDEKRLVLTTSIDAIVKIWDQERVLLRQVKFATAVSCLCFFNADGDLLAGLSRGSVFISRRDVLPEKLPKAKAPQRQDFDSFQTSNVTTYDESFEMTTSAPTTNNSETLIIQVPDEDATSSVRDKIYLPFQALDPETSAKQLLTHVIERPIDAATLQPPVLRNFERKFSNRLNRFTSCSKAESQVCQEKEEDWRDAILPLSPVQKLMRASKQVVLIRRIRKQTLRSRTVVENIVSTPRSSFATSQMVICSQGEEIRKALPTTSLGLISENEPLHYCKHQAPVPSKEKIPRKLWNAVGGEDRRLIVLERNRLPPC
ncbi:WD40/YVTN repeat-like-containing domain [Plasmopara halstedii]|uniref:WD40/YVTN repeat-like-containing domain n=1 Tax=Plasmopara halstedii TaxID=4781 RepID=A0A0N7L3J0_PLAHL|nr:WD40/YVTN repeat-like-containing domain [Plasmopara halstedii]CEG36011.1 WD40/YVTN repeat-like-containing domain [Plasmopara halstedii]|eukprot:XP_024572380.1 WD40/YVTN repeat-like-containing domain [Plasmopara halstedii]